jgi:hypothetical protein
MWMKETRRSSISIVNLGCLASIVLGGLSTSTLAATRDEAVIEPVIAGVLRSENGVWLTKTQTVFDPSVHALVRRVYTAWDAMPSRDLDFVWSPQSLADDKDGKINGVGRLIWRFKGKPAYEPASIFAVYRGAMKDGRAEGEGRYFDRTGLSYRGGWKNGLMDGFGTLILPNSDEYIGPMRVGRANGTGRYIDATGETFEGKFVDGKREGIGTTTLPNRNSYRSSWVAGNETPGSRQLRLAQSGGQPLPGSADDIRIGITIDKSKARDGDLTYAASSNDAQLLIRPDNERLMALWKGNGEIEIKDDTGGSGEYGVLSLTKGQLLPLTLAFQVQNRSAVPLQVTGVYLAVQSSFSDLEPAIQINRQFAYASCASDYRPLFDLENFGWGAAENAAMHFSFVDPTDAHPSQKTDIAKNIGTIGNKARMTFDSELKAAGVDIAALQKKSEEGFACKSKVTAECLQQIRSSGLFGRLSSVIQLDNPFVYVGLAGTLDYDWHDGAGAQHSRSSPFNLRMALAHTDIGMECGEGGERDPIAANPIEFKLDKSDYRLPISFQRSIPAGRTSQLTATVEAAKSSDHLFTLVLQLADGREVRSRPVSLLYFRPSWFRAN